MSRHTKNKAAERRRKEKKARKEAMKAVYASYRDSGKNSKRAARKARTKVEFNPNKHVHQVDHCGNVGCRRCYPNL